ncbi:hypothetical protein MHYP_G00165860 [Metynnis hypsauchen]
MVIEGTDIPVSSHCCGVHFVQGVDAHRGQRPQGLERYRFLQWGAILRLSVQAIRAEAPRRLPVPGCSSPLQGEELQRNKGVT